MRKTMDRPTENDVILKRMGSYNFDAPVKVTLLFEEDETDQLNDTASYSANKFKEKSTDLQKQKYARSPIEAEYFNRNQDVYIRPTLENNYTEKRQTSHSTNKSGARDRTHLLYMLDQVSNNLIEISKCYCYTFNPDVNKNSFSIRQAEVNYYNFKENRFRLSYDTVVKIFLSRENNPSFIEYFITRTIAVAEIKLWHIDKDFLRSLITSLITWVKQKKRCCVRNQIENTDSVRYQSQRSNRKNNKRNPNTNSIQPAQNDNICIFSYGPQNQEIRISIDPKTLESTQKPEKNTNTNVYFMKRSSNFKENKRLEKRPRTETETRIPNILPLIPLTVQPYLDTQHEKNTRVEIHYLNSEKELTTRSSVSRDSGFVSPGINMCPQDQVSPNAIMPATQATSTFNPNMGCCKVCFSMTKFMCTGCFQVYYCSTNCQESHFIIHQLLCKGTQR